MSKKVLFVAIASLALLAVTVLAVPSPGTWNEGAQPPLIEQAEIPVMMVINKYVKLTIEDPCNITLHEKPNNWWEGFCKLNIVNNFPVTVLANIEPFTPNIGGPNAWRCALEGDLDGLDDDTSEIKLGPFPEPGYNFRLYAAVDTPNLILRASNPVAQRVATVYLTITE